MSATQTRPQHRAKGWTLVGVDFTSAPRRAKPITVAIGRIEADAVILDRFETCADWPAFDALLARPGPWLGGFDFPFGLPREAVADLDWPQAWPELVRHCASLGRAGFRAALDAYRESRPPGRRYAHRATDLPAGSHSPLKLVNPPVGLMFLEGTPRLLDAGLSVAGIHAADPHRIAVEAYPGLLARRITAASYKSDDRRKHTDARRAAREQIVQALPAAWPSLALRLEAAQARLDELVADASGDLLDAVLALLQAARCLRAGPPDWGLAASFDPLEGWIAGS